MQSVYDYDKQEHPVTGSEEIDAIVVTRINAYTHEATLSHGRNEIGTFRRVISQDGKHMTVTLRRVPTTTSRSTKRGTVRIHLEATSGSPLQEGFCGLRPIDGGHVRSYQPQKET